LPALMSVPVAAIIPPEPGAVTAMVPVLAVASRLPPRLIPTPVPELLVLMMMLVLASIAAVVATPIAPLKLKVLVSIAV